MTKFCDRSPCDGLLEALGRYVFGNPKAGTITMLTHKIGGGPVAVTIEYCPFCGTCLDNLKLVPSGEVFFVPELPSGSDS